MDVGIRSPLLDFFRRGEGVKDCRLGAVRGAFAARVDEQVSLLGLLIEDADAEVRGAAEATLAQIPNESLAAFLGRSEVPEPLRDFFRGRGVEPASGGTTSDDPLVDAEPDSAAPGAPAAPAEEEEGERQGAGQRLSMMAVGEKMKAAMKGTKEERAILVRDPNKLVSVAVLSSPKLSEDRKSVV